jgi:hypothetical protein
MGGSGSGNWARGGKYTIEDCTKLSINSLSRTKNLQEGCSVSISHSIRNAEDNAEPVKYEISLDWTRCHYGGSRPWFLCPNARCRKRVAFLYSREGPYLCRDCLDLNYQSQHEDKPSRLLSKARKIHRRLGWEGDMDACPPKPKGMWWRTYNRLIKKARMVEKLAWDAAAERYCMGGYA